MQRFDPSADIFGAKKWPMSDPFWQRGGCVCGHKKSLFVRYLLAPYIAITHKGPSLIGKDINAKNWGFWIEPLMG
jgi:hypothetical protein